jgi:hypothetical protein
MNAVKRGAMSESGPVVVSGNADQFGEGLSILSITITSTTALVD